MINILWGNAFSVLLLIIWSAPVSVLKKSLNLPSNNIKSSACCTHLCWIEPTGKNLNDRYQKRTSVMEKAKKVKKRSAQGITRPNRQPFTWWKEIQCWLKTSSPVDMCFPPRHKSIKLPRFLLAHNTTCCLLYLYRSISWSKAGLLTGAFPVLLCLWPQASNYITWKHC